MGTDTGLLVTVTWTDMGLLVSQSWGLTRDPWHFYHPSWIVTELLFFIFLKIFFYACCCFPNDLFIIIKLVYCQFWHCLHGIFEFVQSEQVLF